MVNFVKLEWNKIKYPYLLGLLFNLLMSGLIIIPYLTGYRYNYNIEIWEEAHGIFSVIFPLVAVIPTCWILYYEKKDNFLLYAMTRISKRKYLVRKWLITSLGSGFIIFMGSFLGLIICLFLINNVEPVGTDNAIKKFAGYYFVNKPFIYGFVLSVWRGFLGFTIATFGFVLSLYINNVFIILTGPFAYVMLENFVLAILGVPQYRLVTSYNPSNITAQWIYSYAMGPALLIFVILAMFTYYAWYKKEDIFST